MLTSLLRFEFRRYFRSASTYIYFLVFGAVACICVMAAGNAFEGSGLNVSVGGDVKINSPFGIFAFTILVSYIGILVVAAVAGRAAILDFYSNTHSFFFTAPISRATYLAGRYLAAVLILLLILSSIALGLFLGTHMPGVDRTMIGPNQFLWYLHPYLVMVVPNVIVMSALFFSVAVLSRQLLAVHVASVTLLSIYIAASSLKVNLDNKLFSSLLDPLGLLAFTNVTDYWTTAEKSSHLVPLVRELLWNRELWLGIALLLILITYWRFHFEYLPDHRWRSARLPEPAPIHAQLAALLPDAPRIDGGRFAARAVARIAWMGFQDTVKNVYFAIIVLAGSGFLVSAVHDIGSQWGTPTWPVTYQIAETLKGSFALVMIAVVTFFSGELIWRERDSRINEISDTLPVPEWTLLFGKLLALISIVAALMAFLMATGMTIQLAKGYHHLEPLLYVKLLGLDMIDYCLLSALAITIHVLVNHKYLGHFVMILYYMALGFGEKAGFSHHLYNYDSSPSYTYSDMNGFDHFLGPVFWFDAYWAMCAALLLLAANLFWVRGLAVEWRTRLGLARQRFSRTQLRCASAAIAALLGLGGFILYNTNYLNTYRSEKQQRLDKVRYETTYSKFKKLPQPKITSVKLNCDIDPPRRTLRLRGKYTITNKNASAVDQFLVSTPAELDINKLEFTPRAKLEADEPDMGLRTYRMQAPFAPGASGTLEFDLEYVPSGFSNDGIPSWPVVTNGTFFNSGILPDFGYETTGELTDNDIRRKYGLAKWSGMADIHDQQARLNTDFANDADWVTFDGVISTSADQVALAPGELIREWSEKGRRYFQYQTRGKVRNYFPVLSARYEVIRDRWKDVELAIYYHHGHEFNLARMMQGLKDSLDYCTRNFTPYQNKTLRIVEFPRYETMAQSFPATIPYSESIGFIARVNPADPDDVDYPYYVTAHEVAHQWWGHQVAAANVQGSRVLSESLAQYTALMVMKQKFGEQQMKRFLKYEMDNYLKGRGQDKNGEPTLELVESEPYIYYNKGSIVFYALQDYIGERAVNRVLREFIGKVGYQEPPYTTSLELIDRFRAATPAAYPNLIEDLFESITLYDNKVVSATWSEQSKGHYEAKIKMEFRKLRADEKGAEREQSVADNVDVGIFDSKDKLLSKVTMSVSPGPEASLMMMVEQPPAKVIIDPWYKLVDRNRDDNEMRVTKAK